MGEKRKQLRRQIEELSLDERIMEMESPVEDVETASNNKYHYISENSIQTLLDRAREEVVKNLIKKIEEANCDSISLELLREIDLSKLNKKK